MFRSQAVWSQYAIDAPMSSTLTVPLVRGISPKIPLRREDLPQPTGPVSIVQLDLSSDTVMS